MATRSNLSFLWMQKLAKRDANAQRRHLTSPLAIDFCSNDYLGWAHAENSSIGNFDTTQHGATGSRLLSGQSSNISALEQRIAQFHQTSAALIFNSGFDANMGTIAAISDRHTVFIYDEYCHASLIDGMRLSLSKHCYKFRHNDMTQLANLLEEHDGKPIAIVVESVYSMDGDIAPLIEIVRLSKRYNACIIVDEAHATGVIGAAGTGLVQHLNLQDDIAVRIHTYGKALGCHGAAVVGSQELIELLINFARPFIYSTALPPASYAAIAHSYDLLHHDTTARQRLFAAIALFKAQINSRDWSAWNIQWLKSDTPIQGIIVGDAARTRQIAQALQAQQLDIRPIFSPTVPLGTERLRICLHAFNTETEIKLLFSTLNEALYSI